ncbi:epimerase family protein SDR39U1 [Prorops nasuta]|uniref:epimerase family protein SDR39U1 n=1 Tax=Prorops nasuta TaxID=863751 RepID=UPI0034CEFB7D
MSPLSHVVLGGGTGFIGRGIRYALITEGISCTCVSRMPSPYSVTWEDIKKNGLPDDTSAVINVAGQNVLDLKHRWSSGFKQNVRNSRVETTKLLRDATIASKAFVFATISGVGYYKPSEEIEYTEDIVCQPYDFLSELCHDWEAAAKLPEGSNIRQATIRSGVVLGRDGGIKNNLYLPFLFGMGGPLGDGKQYMPWIHKTDLIEMFMFILQNDDVEGILNGVAPQIVTNNEFTKAFAYAMKKPGAVRVPADVLKFLYNEERAKIILEGQKVSPKRVLELGFKYKFPDINSACKDVILPPYSH